MEDLSPRLVDRGRNPTEIALAYLTTNHTRRDHVCMTKFKDHDAYITAAPESFQRKRTPGPVVRLAARP